MKRRVSDIAVMILSFLVLLALSAETALVGVEAVRGEQWQLIRLTAWLQGSRRMGRHSVYRRGGAGIGAGAYVPVARVPAPHGEPARLCDAEK